MTGCCVHSKETSSSKECGKPVAFQEGLWSMELACMHFVLEKLPTQ